MDAEIDISDSDSIVPWPSTSNAPVPKYNGYLGIVIPERKAKLRVQAINGRCLKSGYRLAWVLVQGRDAYVFENYFGRDLGR